MNNLFQLVSRVMLILTGMFFFFIMLIFGAISAVLLALRVLWYRMTGKKSSSDNVNVKFWTMGKNVPQPSQRPMDNVTDVEVKEIIRPEEMDESKR